MSDDCTAALNRAAEIAADMRVRYPAAGVTWGYIGNLERWGDSRSWRFFSRIPGPPDPNGFGNRETVSFGYARTAGLPALVAWCEQPAANGCSMLGDSVRKAMLTAGMREFEAEFEFMDGEDAEGLVRSIGEAGIRGVMATDRVPRSKAERANAHAVIRPEAYGWRLGCTDAMRPVVRQVLASALVKPWFEEGAMVGPEPARQFWSAIASCQVKAASALLSRLGAEATCATDPALVMRARVMERVASAAGAFLPQMREKRHEGPVIDEILACAALSAAVRDESMAPGM